MTSDEMPVEELFDEATRRKYASCTSGLRPRKRLAKKRFADIKARMVMRIYGVTRAKAERIISERAAAKAEAGAPADPGRIDWDCNADDVLMSADEFFMGE